MVDMLRGLRFPKEVVAPAAFDPVASMSLRKFLVTFERYFDARYFGSEKEKSVQLGKFLKGSAKRAYDAMGGTTTRYRDLKPKLLTWYESERTSLRQRKISEFQSAQMRPDDTCVIFCLRLEQIAEQAFPGSTRLREKKLCAKVRETVPPALAFQIESAQGMTKAFGNGKVSWNSIKKLAENHDKQKRLKGTRSTALVPSDEVGIFYGLPGAPSVRQDVEDAPPYHTREYRNRTPRFEPSPKKRQNAVSECTFCGRAGHSVLNCRRKNGACFSCGERGHFSRQCPSNNRGRQLSEPVPPPEQQVDTPALNANALR